MAEAITIKRSSKIGFKKQAHPADVGAEEAAPAESGPVLTSYRPQSTHNYLPEGICAIIAFLLLVALLVFQYLEFDFYRDAFPIVQPGMGVSVGGESSLPSAEPTADSAPAPADAEPASTAEPAAAADPARDTEATGANTKVANRNAEINANVEP